MKKAVFFTLLILLVFPCIWAQQKFALVIGNSNYSGISRLTNPVNDANDMETALRGLGFTVEKVLNGSLDQMETAVLNLRRRLGGSNNSYGFFFYAGHGVQSSGENYLIPVAADNIRTESQLRDRAVSLQFVMDSLAEAGNELNMIVLDACRDNPFGWARSGGRGLSVVNRAPTGSIVMYATGANSTASDGTGGRNGLFTGYLLNNLRTQGLSVFDVFDKTMDDVISSTGGKQHPELSLRFPGAARAYLGTRPAAAVAAVPAPVQPAVTSAPVSTVSTPVQPTAQPTASPASTQPAPAPAQPVHASTSDGWQFENGTITGYTENETDIVIPSTINGEKVTSIGDYVFRGKQLINVNIPSGIINIGVGAFSSNQLTSVIIPSSVTSIRDYAFSYNELTRVTIQASDAKIDTYAFGFNKVTSVTIGANVTMLDTSFTGGFPEFYNKYYFNRNNRKRAGVYTLSGGKWNYSSM